jgi:hypothetical protein
MREIERKMIDVIGGIEFCGRRSGVDGFNGE